MDNEDILVEELVKCHKRKVIPFNEKSAESLATEGRINNNDNSKIIKTNDFVKLSDPLCHDYMNFKPDKNNLLYLVTYKKIKGKPEFVDHFDYEKPIKFLSSKGQIIDLHYETDKDRRLHFHALFECRKNPYLKSFSMPGYSFDLTEIYDLKGAHDYMSKQVKNKIESSQLLDCLLCSRRYVE